MLGWEGDGERGGWGVFYACASDGGEGFCEGGGRSGNGEGEEVEVAVREFSGRGGRPDDVVVGG